MDTQLKEPDRRAQVKKKLFVAYFYFIGWDCISLGLHICPTLPNIEIHIPFGFIRIGWVTNYPRLIRTPETMERCTFGYKQEEEI